VFALGTRQHLANLIGAHYARKHYAPGDFVKIGAFEGRIVEIVDGCVFLETEAGDVSVPAHNFSAEAFVKIRKHVSDARARRSLLCFHPEAAARLLESMPRARERCAVAVDTATAAPVVGHAADLRRRLPSSSAGDAALLFERLGSRESVAVLRHLPAELRENVLSSLGPQWLMAFKLLLSYPTNTVGAWIEPRVLTLPDDCTAGEARDRVARSSEQAQARIYVLDRARHLRGAVRGVALLQVSGRKKIVTLLEPAEALWAREPLATAQEHGVWERHTEAPVVNRDEEFIGVISYADLRKAFRQIHHVAGQHGDRDMAEVSELFAIGAGSLWRSIGDLIGNDRQR
jgi:Mg/Co/Ni transporter MgtE